MEAGVEVDIARAAGFAMTEEKVLRNTLEKARMTASSPKSTVSVFVVVEYVVSDVEERSSACVVLSVITKGILAHGTFRAVFILGSSRALGWCIISKLRRCSRMAFAMSD